MISVLYDIVIGSLYIGTGKKKNKQFYRFFHSVDGTGRVREHSKRPLRSPYDHVQYALKHNSNYYNTHA